MTNLKSTGRVVKSCACLKYGSFVQHDSFGARRIWILSPLCVMCHICVLYNNAVFISDPPSPNSLFPTHASLIISVWYLIIGTLLSNESNWWYFLFFPTTSPPPPLPTFLSVLQISLFDVRVVYLVSWLFLPSLSTLICSSTKCKNIWILHWKSKYFLHKQLCNQD